MYFYQSRVQDEWYTKTTVILFWWKKSSISNVRLNFVFLRKIFPRAFLFEVLEKVEIPKIQIWVTSLCGRIGSYITAELKNKTSIHPPEITRWSFNNFGKHFIMNWMCIYCYIFSFVNWVRWKHRWPFLLFPFSKAETPCYNLLLMS